MDIMQAAVEAHFDLGFNFSLCFCCWLFRVFFYVGIYRCLREIDCEMRVFTLFVCLVYSMAVVASANYYIAQGILSFGVYQREICMCFVCIDIEANDIVEIYMKKLYEGNPCAFDLFNSFCNVIIVLQVFFYLIFLSH